METNQFIEHKDLIEEFITGKDVQRISEEVNCSKSTVYKYLGGDYKNNAIGEILADLIFKSVTKILEEKGQRILLKINPQSLSL